MLTSPGVKADSVTGKAETLTVVGMRLCRLYIVSQLGKSPGVDIIPSELLNNGTEAPAPVLTTLCQKILETKKCPKGCEHSRSLCLYQTILLYGHLGGGGNSLRRL